MQKKKNIAFLLLIVAVCFLVTGCGKKAELEKNSTIVKYDGGKIKAETLYENLRDKYGISILIDMIDHSILDKKYKTTDEETTYVDNQITKMKSQYNNDDDTFLAAIKQYLGVSSVDELRDMIALEYKRNLAVEDYIKDSIKDDEIQKYYDEEIHFWRHSGVFVCCCRCPDCRCALPAPPRKGTGRIRAPAVQR